MTTLYRLPIAKAEITDIDQESKVRFILYSSLQLRLTYNHAYSNKIGAMEQLYNASIFQNIRIMFYLVTPNESSFSDEHHVPRYVEQVSFT